jgi:hypothetical protein
MGKHILSASYSAVPISVDSTWQNWGLRNARKTAFHAAVQHYCRQLGINTYAPPQPIVFADRDTHLFVPMAQEGDEDVLSPGSAVDASFPEAPTEPVKPVMGFIPPESQRAQLRARKTSRKAVLRSMGAGGDM